MGPAPSTIEHEKTAPDQVAARLADATVAIINKVPLRAETLQAAAEVENDRRRSHRL